MIKVTREQKGNALILRLSGLMDERVHWNKIVDSVPAELHLNMKEVFRINSVGVKGFIRFFRDLTAKEVRLRLLECSPAVVEQINLNSNFACGGVIESIYVPFSCESCQAELFALYQVADLKVGVINFPKLKCTKCGGQVNFDDIQDEYFGFLKR